MRMNCEYTLLIPKENIVTFIKLLVNHIESIKEEKYCFKLGLKNISDYNPDHPSKLVESLPLELQNYEALGVHNGSLDWFSFVRVENGKMTIFKEAELLFCKKGFKLNDKYWDKYPMYLHSTKWNKRYNPTFKNNTLNEM